MVYYWCGKEIEEAVYTKHTKNKKFIFCSESCKQNFKKSGKACAYNRTGGFCPHCSN